MRSILFYILNKENYRKSYLYFFEYINFSKQFDYKKGNPLNAMIENDYKSCTVINILILFLGSRSQIIVYVERDQNNKKNLVSNFRRSI